MKTDHREKAEDRYARYFWEELAAHPGVPPSRTGISERMGWKTSNHSGAAPQWRRDLLTQAGFWMFNGRWVSPSRFPDRSSPAAVEQWLSGTKGSVSA